MKYQTHGQRRAIRENWESLYCFSIIVTLLSMAVFVLVAGYVAAYALNLSSGVVRLLPRDIAAFNAAPYVLIWSGLVFLIFGALNCFTNIKRQA